MSDVVEVLATTAMKTVLEELTPQLQEAIGGRLIASFGPSVQIERRLAEGEAADVTVLAASAVRRMTAQGKLLAGCAVDIAHSSLGIAVRSGAPRPDISSVAAFKNALLAAKSIAVSKPAGAGLSGAHMAKVFHDLGISGTVAGKLKYGIGGAAGLVGLIVARGDAEIGIQQISELKAVASIEFVGPLPAELQIVTTFTAAIPTSARNGETGRRLIRMLTTPAARIVIKSKGLEPA